MPNNFNNKVLTGSGLMHYDEKIKGYIQDADAALQDEISEISSPNIRYVQCTGENDQVAIQAALDELTSTGGTVYVCGKKCGLTSTGVTQKCKIAGKTTWISILNLPSKTVLDFSNCQQVEWTTGTPTDASAQMVLFSFGFGGWYNGIVGLSLYDYDDDTLSTALNAGTSLYANKTLDAYVLSGTTSQKCFLKDIHFYNIPLLFSQKGVQPYKIALEGQNHLIQNITIAEMRAYTGAVRCIRIGGSSLVENLDIKLADFDLSNGTTGENYLLSTGTDSKITNCNFANVNNGYDKDEITNSIRIELGANSIFSNNKISTTFGLYVRIAGRCLVTDNVFQNPKLIDYQNLIETSSNAIISNNGIFNAQIGEACCIVNGYYTNVSVLNNTVSLTRPTADSETTGESAILGIENNSIASGNTVILPPAIQRNSTDLKFIVFDAQNATAAFITGNKVNNLTENDTLNSNGIIINNVIDGELLLKSSPTTSTIVIASQTTIHQKQCVADYICDGVSDENEINSAIASLKSGGKIVLLEGTYIIEHPIVITNDKVSIVGMGRATILKRTFDPFEQYEYPTFYDGSVFNVLASDCSFEKFCVEGLSEIPSRLSSDFSLCYYYNVFKLGDTYDNPTTSIENTNIKEIFTEDYHGSIVWGNSCDKTTVSDCDFKYLIRGIFALGDSTITNNRIECNDTSNIRSAIRMCAENNCEMSNNMIIQGCIKTNYGMSIISSNTIIDGYIDSAYYGSGQWGDIINGNIIKKLNINNDDMNGKITICEQAKNTLVSNNSLPTAPINNGDNTNIIVNNVITG